jgi:hypothetical protein
MTNPRSIMTKLLMIWLGSETPEIYKKNESNNILLFDNHFIVNNNNLSEIKSVILDSEFKDTYKHYTSLRHISPRITHEIMLSNFIKLWYAATYENIVYADHDIKINSKIDYLEKAMFGQFNSASCDTNYFSNGNDKNLFKEMLLDMKEFTAVSRGQLYKLLNEKYKLRFDPIPSNTFKEIKL